MFGNQKVVLETGEIARQAGGAVVVTIDETVVLATVVSDKVSAYLHSVYPDCAE